MYRTNNPCLDFQLDVGHAMKGFIDNVFATPAKVMVLGPTYSSQAQIVANVGSYYNLFQVSL